MKKSILIFLPVVTILLFLASCKKEDSKTRKELLQENTCWNASKIEAKNPETGLYEDYTDLLLGDACYRDNCYTFNVDGVYKETEGVTKCDPTDEELVATGTWSISADESNISITEDSVTRTGKIETLTADKFVITSTDQSLGGIEIRVTYE